MLDRECGTFLFINMQQPARRMGRRVCSLPAASNTPWSSGSTEAATFMCLLTYLYIIHNSCNESFSETRV